MEFAADYMNFLSRQLFSNSLVLAINLNSSSDNLFPSAYLSNNLSKRNKNLYYYLLNWFITSLHRFFHFYDIFLNKR